MYKNLKIFIIFLIFILLISLKIEKVNALSTKDIARAKKENKFLFLFFYEKGSDQCDRMSKILKEAKSKWSHKAKFINIDINDNKEKEIISKYGIWRAPVTLIMTPNGIIITGFPGVVELEDLEKVFISPKMIEIMEGLQEKKVIFLLIQNKRTKYAKENLKTVNNVTEVLKKSIRVVKINPKDNKEKKLLSQINVNPNISNSTIVVISQSGRVGDRLEGKTSNRELFLSFKKILAQKSGCGSGGCGGK